jgi:hypothetical protein
LAVCVVPFGPGDDGCPVRLRGGLRPRLRRPATPALTPTPATNPGDNVASGSQPIAASDLLSEACASDGFLRRVPREEEIRRGGIPRGSRRNEFSTRGRSHDPVDRGGDWVAVRVPAGGALAPGMVLTQTSRDR